MPGGTFTEEESKPRQRASSNRWSADHQVKRVHNGRGAEILPDAFSDESLLAVFFSQAVKKRFVCCAQFFPLDGSF